MVLCVRILSDIKLIIGTYILVRSGYSSSVFELLTSSGAVQGSTGHKVLEAMSCITSLLDIVCALGKHSTQRECIQLTAPWFWNIRTLKDGGSERVQDKPLQTVL